MGRSRGGLTTKIHALTDARGLPLELVLTPGQAGDCPVAAQLLGHLRKDTIVLADKAYDADWLRRQIEAAGAAPNIPPMVHYLFVEAKQAALCCRFSTGRSLRWERGFFGSGYLRLSPKKRQSIRDSMLSRYLREIQLDVKRCVMRWTVCVT